MKDYGSVLKQIRTGKRIPQSFFGKKNLLSQSQLSRIESGRSEATFKDVVKILDTLHVQIEEFLYISNNYSHHCSWQIIIDVQEALNKNDLKALKELKAKLYDKSLISDDFIYQHYLYICKAHIKSIEGSFHESQKIIKPIKDHLLKVDDWCIYEMLLLKHSLYFLDKNFVDTINSRIFRSIEKYKAMENGYPIYTSFISTLAFYYLKNRDFKKSLLLCSQILNNKINKNIMFDTIELSIIKGIAVCMTGEKQDGIELIQDNYFVLKKTNFSDSLYKFNKILAEFGIEIDGQAFVYSAR